MIWSGRYVVLALFALLIGMGASPSLAQTAGPQSAEVGTEPSNSDVASGAPPTKQDSRRAKRRKAKEAQRRAALSKRITPVRKDEMPPGCPYDSIASLASSGDVYSCEGLHFHGVQEGEATSFEGYAPDVSQDEIQRARDIRAKAIKQVNEAAEREQKKELPADCAFDAFASAANGTEIYSCGTRRYVKSEKDGQTGFRDLKP